MNDQEAFDVFDNMCSDLEKGAVRPDLQPVGPALSFLSDMTREDMRARKDDLAFHSRVVAAVFHEWRTMGEYPAPGYAHRIGVILRREKQPERDERFLKAYLRYGRSFQTPELVRRAEKLGLV